MTIYMQTEKRALKETPMSDAERNARVELAAAYRIVDMLGWTEMIFNHITVRVPGPEVRFLGIPKDMKPNRPPTEGLQFFGTLKADGKTRVLTARLHNAEGKTIFTVELPPER